MTIVKEELGNQDVHIDSSIIENCNMNVIDEIELIIALEDEFGIEIPDKDSMKFDTVNDVITFVDNKINGK